MRLRLPLLALLLAGAHSATAQSDTQEVTVVVEEVNEISISGPVTLTISAAAAGAEPAEASDATTTYAVTTNGTGKKITGQLGADFASGIALRVQLAAPTGGAVGTAGTGLQLGASAAVDLVTGLASVSQNSLAITYRATATPDVAPNDAGETQTVTFTITADS